jgi:hypothetical protein
MTMNKAEARRTIESLNAVGSPVDRRVRPVAQVQRMGSFHGVPHYGCLLNLEAEHRMKVNDPLYGQAELDAAVAAERERCASICDGIGATYTGAARRLDGQHATHAAGQRDGANECAAEIRRA